MSLSFLGAAREVTGSCFLVEAGGARFLVDCGMVQGGREAPPRNRKPLDFDPATIDFVLLPHAHIDHSGLLPKLTRAGFKGAIHATEATADLLGVMLPDSAHIQETDPRRGWHKVGTDLAFLKFTASVDESKALNQIRARAIIISAGATCDAGHIRHHLRQNLPRPESVVMITGFQAKGTLGRRLVDGARRAHLFGDDIPVHAAIHAISGLSAHADRTALMAWADGFKAPPRRTFVVHGEETAALEFADALRNGKGWEVTVPEPGASFESERWS